MLLEKFRLNYKKLGEENMFTKMVKFMSLVVVFVLLAGVMACQAQPTPTAAPAAPAAPAATQAPAVVPPTAVPQPTTAPTTAQRTFTIWHYESATGAMGKAWDAAVKQFQTTHPDVKVVLDSTRGFEQIQQTASMVLNSDQAPDVMEYNKGNATSGLLSSQGLLTDMTDEVTKRGWDKIIVGGLQTTSRYDNGVMGSGKWYGITDYGEFVMVYYNKDLFKKYNVAIPTTLAEFEAAMAKFKAAGLTPIATSGAEYPAQQVFYELALSQATDSTFVDDYQLYKAPIDFHGKEFTFGANTMADWVKKGYIEKNSTSMKAEDMGLGFESGKYPMMISGSWWYGRFMTEIKNFDWGIFLFPGNKYNAGSGGNLWVIPQNSKNKDLAYDFIDITLSKPIQTILANAGGIAVNADVSQVTDPKIKDLTQAFSTFSPGAAFYPDWPAAGLYNALVSDVQELINGTKTPDQTLSAISDFYSQNKPK
jgi:raffinose/stachyose/melibiose transport system substrate-binding protein